MELSPMFVGAIFIGILVAAYYLYLSLQPSESKALSAAKPKFTTYDSVMKLAPLGCPQPSEYRLCDYYIASSSYSVFPGADVYDYISDKILPMVIKAESCFLKFLKSTNFFLPITNLSPTN